MTCALFMPEYLLTDTAHDAKLTFVFSGKYSLTETTTKR